MLQLARPEWMRDARCRSLSTAKRDELFFPTEPDVVRKWGTDGIVFCQGCDHRLECLSYAIDHQEEGIWGGTREVLRNRLAARGWAPEDIALTQDSIVESDLAMRANKLKRLAAAQVRREKAAAREQRPLEVVV